MVIDRLILEGRLTQLALMQVFTILPICLSPVIGIVNQLVHFAEVSELAGINFSHGGTYITSDNFPAQKISFKISVALPFSPLVPKLHNPSMLVMTGLQSDVGGFVLLTL